MDRDVRDCILCLLETALRLVIGGVFIWASLSKLDDPAIFASQVAAYDVLPQPLTEIVALVLPPMELLTGCMLIATKWSREAALVMLAMMAVFVVALVQAMARGLDISCGCFADETLDRGTMALAVALLRDFLMIAPLVWIFSRPGRYIWRKPSRDSSNGNE